MHKKRRKYEIKSAQRKKYIVGTFLVFTSCYSIAINLQLVAVGKKQTLRNCLPDHWQRTKELFLVVLEQWRRDWNLTEIPPFNKEDRTATDVGTARFLFSPVRGQFSTAFTLLTTPQIALNNLLNRSIAVSARKKCDNLVPKHGSKFHPSLRRHKHAIFGQ